MKKTRFTEEQMVTIPGGGCQADPGGGEEAWGRAGHDLRLAEALWRLEPTDVKRLRQLEQENGRLKNAQVASNAQTGTAQVQQGGGWSNAVTFTVTGPPIIASVSPAGGVVGTPVTMVGARFGAAQGTGTVMLGTINVARS